MKRTRKAFTLIEAVVTIAIMSIVFGISAVCFTNLIRIQNEASENTRRQSEANRINSVISDYVSFVSVKTPDLAFNFDSETGTSIIITTNLGSSHTLKYENKFLIVTYSYSGSNDYLKYTNSISVDKTSSIVFDFDETLNLLSTTCRISGKDFKFAHVFKV